MFPSRFRPPHPIKIKRRSFYPEVSGVISCEVYLCERRGGLANLITGYRWCACAWLRCPCFFIRVSSDGRTAESCSACGGERGIKTERMQAERLLQERRGREEKEEVEEGVGNGEGGREGEIVTPRRRVQRQGNERLPALHHAQGLPQSAGGRGKMPHVSGLLALPLVCMHLGLHECVCVCVCFMCVRKTCGQDPCRFLHVKKVIFFSYLTRILKMCFV